MAYKSASGRIRRIMIGLAFIGGLGYALIRVVGSGSPGQDTESLYKEFLKKSASDPVAESVMIQMREKGKTNPSFYNSLTDQVRDLKSLQDYLQEADKILNKSKPDLKELRKALDIIINAKGVIESIGKKYKLSLDGYKTQLLDLRKQLADELEKQI